MFALIIPILLPAAAHAQASISGTVTHASGAVLPGATVEASSPALIEKARVVVTDAMGLYRIVDLRPGVYTITFSLQSFTTVKREAIELPTAFTATVNAELRVGALEETVTVSGASPTVDIQGITRQSVLSREVLDALPTAKSVVSFGFATVRRQSAVYLTESWQKRYLRGLGYSLRAVLLGNAGAIAASVRKML